MMRQLEIRNLLKEALECSVYVTPTSAGLSWDEVREIGKQFEYGEGEIDDAIKYALQAEDAVQYGRRLEPGENLDPMWDQFHYRTDPDYRDLRAFDHVWQELRDVARTLGSGRGEIERSVLVERGVAKGIDRKQIEVAIQVSVYAKHFVEKEGVLTLPRQRENYLLPSEQLAASASRYPEQPRHRLRKLYPIVKDIVERRTDGRSSAVEALDAFADKLAILNHGAFRSWWLQTVSELRNLNVALNPVTACVLSAALVEGALTFVVKHAKAINIGPMGSKTFNESPTSWKIDDLVSSAASGGPSAILDQGTRQRADHLIKTRQRIHAGRMLVDFPTGVPDLRPEEARDAKNTADLVLRKIVDWIDKNPTSSPPPPAKT